MNIVERITHLHEKLADNAVPHAFGGALALAWCTQRARATIDIDINLFVDVGAADVVLGYFPDEIAIDDAARKAIAEDGQVRLWWDQTPVDVFFNTTGFHRRAVERVSFEDFAGYQVPFLACRDLAVFKAFFNRTKDWADLEEMVEAGTLDVEAVLGVIANYLGPDDERIERLRSL